MSSGPLGTGRTRSAPYCEFSSAQDYEKVYGFIGENFRKGPRVYRCLIASRFHSQIDPAADEIMLPDDGPPDQLGGCAVRLICPMTEMS